MQAAPRLDPLEARQLREILDLVRDRFAPDPRIYWADLALSSAVTLPAFAYALVAQPFGALAGLAAVVATFGFFRIGTFIHEIQHLGTGRLVPFKVAWNALVGVPFLVNSTLYDNHAEHHNPRHYGTVRDGEYLPLGRSLAVLARYVAQVPAAVPLAILRFGVLVPLSFLHPRLRRLLLERASSYGINPGYVRPIPEDAPRALWAALDLAGCAWVWTLIGLGLSGVLAPAFFLRLYLVATGAVALNWLRNLVAHSYTLRGEPVSQLGQLRDSITIDGNPLWTELFFPLGLRYHALHHLLPALPYHALGSAHRKLMRELPPKSPYRDTVRSGLGVALAALVAHARSGGPGDREPESSPLGVRPPRGS